MELLEKTDRRLGNSTLNAPCRGLALEGREFPRHLQHETLMPQSIDCIFGCLKSWNTVIGIVEAYSIDLVRQQDTHSRRTRGRAVFGARDTSRLPCPRTLIYLGIDGGHTYLPGSTWPPLLIVHLQTQHKHDKTMR